MTITPKGTILLFIAEALVFGLSLCLIFLWIKHPTENYEAYLGLTTLVFTFIELFRRYAGRLYHLEGAKLTPAKKIHHGNLLRPQFVEEINRCKRENLRKDAIIRHVNRIDDYPNISEGKGISSWFKIGLLDTYHRGVLVGLGWKSLVESPNGLRRPNYRIGEKGGFNAMLIGEIPYDSIESLNINGDKYYNLPHIYCHFEHKGQPYERLYYAQEIDMGNGRSFWKEIASYEEVTKNSKMWGWKPR